MWPSGKYRPVAFGCARIPTCRRRCARVCAWERLAALSTRSASAGPACLVHGSQAELFSRRPRRTAGARSHVGQDSLRSRAGIRPGATSWLVVSDTSMLRTECLLARFSGDCSDGQIHPVAAEPCRLLQTRRPSARRSGRSWRRPADFARNSGRWGRRFESARPDSFVLGLACRFMRRHPEARRARVAPRDGS